MSYFLGIDVSTTGAKAILVDEDGAVIASHNEPHPISTPRPLWSEQNPADWWNGVAASIREVLKHANVDDIYGVGLTGQMHSLVCLDKDGQVLRPAILWNDQRTQTECDDITARVGEDKLVRITGNRALTGFTAPKILWIRKHEPEIYAQIRRVLVAKDYIRYKLTGEFGTDVNEASGMLLMDVARRDWSDEVLAALEIPSRWLPEVHEGHAITGFISAEAAEITGLRVGIPVVAGGGDQAAQAVGVGAVESGVIALTVGTSGVVFAPTDHYAFEPQGRLMALCHSVPDRWHFMGVTLSAAGSLQWYRNTLAAGVAYDDLTAETASIPPGSEGLQFLPYLSGERTPYPDPLARGAFIGLTTRHTRAHMTRAVMEGVAFSLRDVFELIKVTNPQIKQVRVSGGGANSPLWRQIFADVLNVPLVTVDATEGAAYGAALLVGLSAKVFGSVEALTKVVRTGEESKPGGNAIEYADRYAVYRTLYPTLKSTFAALARG
jgi:xylulokinase